MSVLKISGLLASVALLLGTVPAASAADVVAETLALRKSVKVANGMTLGYIELGDPQAPPLVYLHGFTNSSLGYVPLARLLAQHRRVFLLDQRGHGISDKPDCCYTRVDFAYDIKLFLDHVGVERADIAGHSLGSIVAQTFAAYWPERTRRLILIAGTMGHRSPASPRDRRPPPALKSFDAEIRKLRDPIDPDSPFMVAWWTVPGLDADVQRMMRRESARIPADIWRAILDQGEATRDLRTTVNRIQAPTLLMFAGKDSLFGPRERREFLVWYPSAKVVDFPELGHSLPEENPAVVAESIHQFLSSP